MVEKPAALALLANLYVVRTKGDPKQRAIFKEAIFKRLNELKIPSEMFLEMFNFVKDLMTLPKRLENKIMEKVLAPKFKRRSFEDRLPKSKLERMAFFELLYRNQLGISLSSLQRRKEELETQAQKAEIKARKAEMEAKKVEMEVKKLKASIRTFAKKMNWSAEEIAANLGLELAFVQQVLKVRAKR